jgi:hypothetical protein
LADAALLALHRSFRGPFEIPQGLPTNGRVPLDSQSMTASELSGKVPYRYREPARSYSNRFHFGKPFS